MLGDYDVLGILKMRDSLSDTALSMAIMGGCAIKNVMTTQFMSWNEGREAMKKARSLLVSPEKDQMLDRQ